jgi:hypothetical protein
MIVEFQGVELNIYALAVISAACVMCFWMGTVFQAWRSRLPESVAIRAGSRAPIVVAREANGSYAPYVNGSDADRGFKCGWSDHEGQCESFGSYVVASPLGEWRRCGKHLDDAQQALYHIGIPFVVREMPF